MIGIQIIGILFVLWMTYFSFLHFRRREFSLWEFIFWQLIWLVLAYIVIFPESVHFLLTTFNIARAFDLLTIGGMIILFGATFRNYVILRRTERKVEEFIRQLAIRDK